jgi:DNA-binding NarL/FixJ family response regulator
MSICGVRRSRAGVHRFQELAMPKKVLLVGHCGPDSSYLRMSVRKAVPDVEILSADDGEELTKILERGIDLILFNRELGYGYDPDTGVEAIRALRPTFPDVRMMVVTNYDDVQRQAQAAGAQPGFGKKELGTARVAELLRDALGGAKNAEVRMQNAE